MKVFKHTWDQEIFLLHIQLDNSMQENYQFTISKNFGSAPDKKESNEINADTKSHRFIVSRSHTDEKGFSIEYPDHVILQAFIIEDRAYYPTEAFYTG